MKYACAETISGELTGDILRVLKKNSLKKTGSPSHIHCTLENNPEYNSIAVKTLVLLHYLKNIRLSVSQSRI